MIAIYYKSLTAVSQFAQTCHLMAYLSPLANDMRHLFASDDPTGTNPKLRFGNFK